MSPHVDMDRFDVTCASDIRPAAEALSELALTLGPYRAVVSHNIASKQPMVDADGAILASAVFGFDAVDDWWRDPQLALHSPVARACRYESEPFWLNAKAIFPRCPNPYLDEIDLTLFEALAVGPAMIVVPVHLPFGQIGLAAYASAKSGSADQSNAFDDHADLLALASRRFISGYAKVMRNRRWVPSNCRLTKREIECLRWAAIGKTDTEIGLIIGRRHSTVRFHVNNAIMKLDAVNRGQAIFKAGQLGYLGLA
jgi:DNA-binding CsgD family transcriptional regulator